MPGVGIRPAILSAEPKARLLDLTRLASRVGQGPWTGIDRVEHAYLTWLLAETVPVFGVVRLPFGYLLLDRVGTAAFAARLNGDAPWGMADLLGRLMHRTNQPMARAATDLRRLAIARCRHRGLAAMLARHLSPATSYLNVGHSNLTPQMFDAVRKLPESRSAVLIHDTIPLDWPAYSSAAAPASFEAKARAVAAGASCVIYPSQCSRTGAERHFQNWGYVPEGTVVPLGVSVAAAAPSALPAGLDRSRPYFVTVGTIEPRKNHALLLDIWEALGDDLSEHHMPHLFIVGRRGWRNEAVFNRLDARPANVTELADLSDPALSALVSGARALLFPSFAEGYGLPPLEAAMLGVPVVLANLPVYQETLGAFAIYHDPTDAYSWKKSVLTLLAGSEPVSPPRFPTWDAHFERVLSLA